MLFDADNTHAVANTLQTYYAHSTMPPLICDPVCISTTGHTLLHSQAIEIMIQELFPLTTLITPNKSEAELLLSHRNFPCEIFDLEDMIIAAKNLTTLGPQAVLLTGGHIRVSTEDVQRVSRNHSRICFVEDGLLNENMEILQVAERDASTLDLVVDVLHQYEDKTTLFLQPRIISTNTHGTGCTLSAALACGLGRGLSRLYYLTDLSSPVTFITILTVSSSIRSAAAYTHLGIETAFSVGKGCGPLNHLHSFVHRIIPL
jgi:hydroxymethylpyrimidine/phosphomethylpyrimidine kinase / thiaminase